MTPLSTQPNSRRHLAALPTWRILVGLGVCAGCLGALLAQATGKGEQSSSSVEPRVGINGGDLPPATVRPGEVLFSPSGSPRWRGALLPAETPEIIGRFGVGNGLSPSDLAVTWFWNAVKVDQVSVAVEAARRGIGGIAEVKLRPPHGVASFGPGIGEVEVAAEGKTVARGTFTTAPASAQLLAAKDPDPLGVQVIGAQTAREVDLARNHVAAEAFFAPGQKVWLVFDYERADPGGAFEVRWFGEGTELRRARTTVTCRDARGRGVAWLEPRKPDGLPAGQYTASLTYGGQQTPLARCSFRVVPALVPTPPPPPVKQAPPATSQARPR